MPLTVEERLDRLEQRFNITSDTAIEAITARDEGVDVSCMFDADGKLLQTLPLYKMPTDKGQLHFLCPPGIGDFAWCYAKLWSLCETRDVTFWFPNDNVKRVAPYCQMMKLNHDFVTFDMKACIDAPCDYTEEDLKDGGVFYLHANTHVESGERLENWLPWLPIKNPAPTQVGRWTDRSNDPGIIGRPKPVDRKPEWEYVVIHMGHHGYGEGNWPPRMWARAVKTIQDHFGLPVMPIGAFWDKAFMDDVMFHVDFKKTPCMDRTLKQALTACVNARAFIGVDSGLAILAKYLGVPCQQFYPGWLVSPDRPTKRNPKGTHMPGAWELDAHPMSGWGLMDEALDKDEPNSYYGFLERLLA